MDITVNKWSDIRTWVDSKKWREIYAPLYVYIVLSGLVVGIFSLIIFM